MNQISSDSGTHYVQAPTDISRIAVFIDWNSQLWLTGLNVAKQPLPSAKAAFSNVARRIVTALTDIAREKQFIVHLRLYHGWHKGYEPSINRKAVRQVIAETDFAALSSKPNVVFSAEVGFGDCLISALPARLHPHLGIHLPNTLRDREPRGTEEKMVDTALAADVIVTAYQDPSHWIMVVAEDDDIVPPLFVAEAVIKHMNSRVLLLSNRSRSRNFLKLENIVL